MTETTQTSTQETTAPSLQIADLIVVANLIQAVAQRGAIRADEMELVGGVYTKLNQFLVASGAIPAPDANTEKPEDTKND